MRTDGKTCNQLRQQTRQLRARRHQHRAHRGVGDVAPVFLAETDDDAVLARDMLDAEARLAPIAVGGPGNAREQAPRAYAAHAFQDLEQHALLRRELGPCLQVLEGAAAAEAEMRARRRDALRRCRQHPSRRRFVVAAMRSQPCERNRLVRQGTVDEYGLAGGVRHPATIVGETVDACRGRRRRTRAGHRIRGRARVPFFARADPRARRYNDLLGCAAATGSPSAPPNRCI